MGYPSASTFFVFNGDFVDRGAWGLEIVLLLAALKVAAPACVALVRGNHESLYCRCVVASECALPAQGLGALAGQKVMHAAAGGAPALQCRTSWRWAAPEPQPAECFLLQLGVWFPGRGAGQVWRWEEGRRGVRGSPLVGGHVLQRGLSFPRHRKSAQLWGGLCIDARWHLSATRPSAAPSLQAVFAACRNLFSHLPLAAVVAGAALVLHGGLPRAPPKRVTRRSSASAGGPLARHAPRPTAWPDAAVHTRTDSEPPARALCLLPIWPPFELSQRTTHQSGCPPCAAAGASEPRVGSLADIAACSKGGEDPDPQCQDQRVAADVLWSDPASQPGVQQGARAGDVGIRFGPDVTEVGWCVCI